MKTVCVFLLIIAGCADRALYLPEGTPDLAMPDARMPDLGVADLAVPPDLASPPPDLLEAPGLTLLAGGLGGKGSADGTGMTARFSGAGGIVADGAGHLYAGGYSIRRIDLSSGAVSTVAGTPIGGSADGTGATAGFSFALGLALDGAGHLFVADNGNDTIRKVVLATGEVTTLAGQAGVSGSDDGTGAAARFNQPEGLAADGNGNLYVADTWNQTIRKIVVATGEVTTLAGGRGMTGSADGTGTSARFYAPHAVVFDGGRLFVSDTFNCTIRQIVLASAEVTTLAGAPAGPNQPPGDVDGVGTAARFHDPKGLASDGAGHLFVGDYENGTVREIVIATGAVTTLAGGVPVDHFNRDNNFSVDGTGAAARFAFLGDLASDGAGHLFVPDQAAIREIVVAGAVVTSPFGAQSQAGDSDGRGAAARLQRPRGITSDGQGHLFVDEYMSSDVRRISLADGTVTTLVSGLGLPIFESLSSLVSDGAGKLYVPGSVAIFQVATDTGQVTNIADGNAWGFHSAYGIALDGGDLYFSDGSGTVRKLVLASGEVTVLAGSDGMYGASDGTGAAARFNSPSGLALDGAGHLFVADAGNCTIRQITLATAEVTTLAGTAGACGGADGVGAAARFRYPIGLASDSAGHLFVADSGNATLRKIVVATGEVTTVVGTALMAGAQPGPFPAGLNCPAGVAVVGADVAITDECENAVLVAHRP